MIQPTRLGSTALQPDSASYTDLNRLQQFKRGGDKAENIQQVAKEFEALFVSQMLKGMRSANQVLAEGNYTTSKDTEFYQEMHDQQLAVTLSKGRGIGMGDVLARQMLAMKEPASAGRSNPFAQASESKATTQAPASFDEALRDVSALLESRRLYVPGRQPLASADPEQQASDATPAVAVPAEVAAPVVAEASTPVAASRQPRSQVQAPAITSFDTPQQFVEAMLPMAEEAAQRLGIEPRYLVAQAALETGWGKSIIRRADGSISHNLFGIKSHGGWQGDSARVTTTEYRAGAQVKEVADFRSYDSFRQSFHDYVDFLEQNGRYQEALSTSGNSEQFVRELQQAGYATDPQYAQKISRIARQMQTYQAIAATGFGPNG